MKKIVSIFILAVLAAVTIFVPQKVFESKQAYEERMVAIIAAIKARIKSKPTTTPVSVGIYAPMIGRPDNGRRFSVSGIVSLRIAGSAEHAERFAAEIQNKCTDKIDPLCLEVQTLTVKGTVFLQTNELATVFGDLPFRIANPDPPSELPGVAVVAVGAPPKEPAIRKQPTIAEKPEQAIQKKGEAKSPKADSLPKTQAPPASKANAKKSPRDEVPARPVAKVETVRAPKGLPAPPQTADAGTRSVNEPSTPARAAADPPATPAIKTNPEISAEPARPPEQASTAEPNPAARLGSAPTELASPLPDTRPKPTPLSKIGDSSERVLQIQRALRRLGYDPGPADNLVGQRTRTAILSYQRQNGLEATGRPSLGLLKHILTRSSTPEVRPDRLSKNQTTAFGGSPRTQTASLSPSGASDRIAQVQLALQRFGYDVGQVDNVVGRKTRAILAYQRRNGLEPTGEPSQKLLDHIRGIAEQPATP